MRNVLFILLALLIGTLTLSAEDMDIITGKITLSDGGDAKMEVYVYYNRFRNNEDNLLKIVEVDKSGEFIVEIPDGINYAELHLAAEGYEAFMTKYIEGDENPRLEATLHKRKVKPTTDSAAVYMFLSRGRVMEKEVLDENGRVEFDIDLNDEKYSKVYKKDGSVSYVVIIGEQAVSPENHKGEWEYDHNGDYNAVVETDDGKWNVTIDVNDYSTSEDENELSMTSGEWIKSPVNEAYSLYEEQVPSMEVANLRQDYYYYVQQKSKGAIKNLSEETLEKRKNNTLTKFNRFVSVSDSLLAANDSPYLTDFVSLTKQQLMKAADSLDTWEHNKKLLRSLQELPTVFYANFNDIIYDDVFKENPKPYIEALENVYLKSLNKRNRYYLRYGLYSRLAGSEFADNPEYVEALRTELKEIGKFDDLDRWPRDGVAKDLAKLKLKSMTHAPDFAFKTTDGKETKLSEYRGKWVLLDFWGTWCGPCRGETPHLAKAYNELKDDGFVIIGVSSDRSVKVVADYMEKNKMEWPNTIDIDGYAKGVLKQYGINSFPTVMLVDPDGKFVKLKSHELRGKGLITTLKEQMGG